MSLVTYAADLLQDIEYARPDGVSLRLDAAVPQGDGPFPAVIIVHGGGWVRGDRRSDVQPLFAPLAAAGFAWFSIDYRLTTDWMRFGEAVDDVEEAIRFVKSHAKNYRVDASRIGLIGESAGGQLAAMAALRIGAESPVRAVVALYTPMDLVGLARTSAFAPEQIRNALAGSPMEPYVVARLSKLSPIENVAPNMPPFLLIHGTDDPLVPYEQSRLMYATMSRAGASCELYTVPGAGHGLLWWESDPAMARGYKREMVHWLNRHLGTHGKVDLSISHNGTDPEHKLSRP
jgi:alpha-L-fucosidase 2